MKNVDLVMDKKKYEFLEINLDHLEFEFITIIRDGEKITLPVWEFWQILSAAR